MENIRDMFEMSNARRKNWNFVKDKSGEFVSVLQCNSLEPRLLNLVTKMQES